MLRALPSMMRVDRAQFLEGGEWLRRALDRQPDNAPAHAWYAHWLQLLVEHGWADDVGRGRGRGARHAERAITLDPQNARAFAVAGHVRRLPATADPGGALAA